MKHLLTLLALVAFFNLSAQRPFDHTKERTFAASGDAIIRVQPDQVVLRLGLETKGKELVPTKEENYSIIEQAITYCKKAGIPAKHIQTDYISIRPSYNHRSDLKADHYNVAQILCIVIEDVPSYETILTDLLLMGINKVDQIQFRTTKIKEYRKKVRKLAIAAAKEKAKFLTEEVDIKLGSILNISEYTNNPGSSFNRANYANFSQNIVQETGVDQGASPLSLGLISLKANVTLTYAVE